MVKISSKTMLEAADAMEVREEDNFHFGISPKMDGPIANPSCSTTMSTNYVFSLQPTFTQGLILGQLSIMFLLALILQYLFLDSTESPFETSSYHPRVNSDIRRKGQQNPPVERKRDSLDESGESADWFNALLQQVRLPSCTKVSFSPSCYPGCECVPVQTEKRLGRATG